MRPMKRITDTLFQIQREQTGVFVRKTIDGVLIGLGHQTINLSVSETVDLTDWLIETVKTGWR